MHRILGLVLVSVLLLAAAPAFAAKASQMWKCEIDGEVSEEEVIAMGEAWAEAAKKVKGGENLKFYLRWPVAVNAIGEFDVFIEAVFPTFEEWGKFWDNYSGSAAAKLEDKHADQGVFCPASAVWEIEALE